MKNYFKSKVSEEEKLDNVFFEDQINEVIKYYTYHIKAMIITLILIWLVVICLYSRGEHTEDEFGKYVVTQTYVWMWYLFICLSVVYITPQMISYLIPFTIRYILFFLIITTQVSTFNSEYRFCEFYMNNALMGNVLVVIMPSQYKANCIAFILAMVYMCSKVYWCYGVLPTELIVSAILSSQYFCINSVILFNRLRKLYGLIRKNQELYQEMKNLLKVFPESVIIRADRSEKNGSKKYFANQQFNSSICDIQNEIYKMSKIQCWINYHNPSSTLLKKYQTSLQNFMKKQEDKLKNKKFAQCESMYMREGGNTSTRSTQLNSNAPEEEEHIKYFQVKTLKVSWEGWVNAFLHVFVNITDIKKLEEANYNIKLQKVMFSNLSDEF